ncbi:MAG: hypothetical protein J6V44_09550 [Methanobrevibacter sp.]|nr:hypothetical protein [Methanobrevibacter sp.]
MPDINKSYSWAIDTCNAPNIAYSTAERNQGRAYGNYICYDCSSFIFYALKAGGFPLSGYPFSTPYMPSALIDLGFVEVDKNGEWKKGDIVWRSKEYTQMYVNPNSPYGHTEMVYEGGIGQGITMGAHQHYSGDAAIHYARDVAINTTITPASNYERVYRYGNGAEGRGYSLYVISAILGNFYQESQINPGVWQDKQDGHTWTDLDVGYGLGQWTNISQSGGVPVPDPEHGRLYQLGKFLEDNNYPADSGDGQIAFMIDEDIWFTGGVPSDYANLTEFLESTDTDLTKLTTEWYNHWEGMNSDDGSLSLRIQYAEYFYNYLLANANNTSVTEWYTENWYIDMKYSEQNAIMFYRTLGSGGGGGGKPEKQKHMPVWMMILRKLK